MEQIKSLLESMESDKAFGNKMQELMIANDVDALVAAAKESGIDITEEDWKAYTERIDGMDIKAPSGQLDPEELTKVAGGASKGTIEDPHIAKCWFYASPMPREYKKGAWRQSCWQMGCKRIVVEGGASSWHQCGCWGTPRCVDNCHLEGGCS